MEIREFAEELELGEKEEIAGCQGCVACAACIGCVACAWCVGCVVLGPISAGAVSGATAAVFGSIASGSAAAATGVALANG